MSVLRYNSRSVSNYRELVFYRYKNLPSLAGDFSLYLRFLRVDLLCISDLAINLGLNVKELISKAVELAKYLDKFVKLPRTTTCRTEISLKSILFKAQ